MKYGILIIGLWLILICNAHCQCIDSVGHKSLTAIPKFSMFYETYPDSLFQIRGSWYECTCIKCSKQYAIYYKQERKLLWRRN